jgi:hypothetical protein
MGIRKEFYSLLFLECKGPLSSADVCVYRKSMSAHLEQDGHPGAIYDRFPTGWTISQLLTEKFKHFVS